MTEQWASDDRVTTVRQLRDNRLLPERVVEVSIAAITIDER